MRHIICLAGLAVGTLALQPLSATAQSTKALAKEVATQGRIVELVHMFVNAQHDFDQPRLRALTSDDYVEISPLGDVDPRDKMLGFYAPDKKATPPEIKIGDATVTMAGDRAAVVVTQISYVVPIPGQPPRTASLRAVFVATRSGDAWKLISAQYTPIRPKS